MRDVILKKLADWHAFHPWRMLLVVMLLMVVFGTFAGHLKVTMRWSDLLPSGDRRTIQFNKIIDEFVSTTSLVVVVQGGEAGADLALADQEDLALGVDVLQIHEEVTVAGR